MKITAEFNSNEELLGFIRAFGASSYLPMQTAIGISPIQGTKILKAAIVDKQEEIKKVVTKALEGVSKVANEELKEVITPKEVETPKDKVEETPKAEDKKEEAKITKEMIRERLGAIMKAGKQKEAKDLLAKHGASKLPDLEEKEYAAVYKEAEVLI